MNWFSRIMVSNPAALGAGSGRIQRDVIFSTLRFAAAGIALGTVASILFARLMASLLFGISRWDLSVYVTMVVTLVGVALASGYLPARRASRIDPMRALRNY
jgi:ABC-type antimicrobial peptide transport system permease subunit